MTNWDYFFVYSSVFSPLIPLFFLLRGRYNAPLRIIILFISLSFLTDLVSVFLFGNNYTVLHLYGFLEALILFWFFNTVIKNQKWIPFLAIAFSVFYLINSIWFEWGVFNTIGRSVECLIMIFLSLRLFYQFFKLEEDIFIDRSPIFWISIGVLVYFSGAFFTFTLSKYILTDAPLWILHNISNVLKNVFLAIGLWKASKK
ncbi:hypothetical protein EV198_1896 [Roseivirga ehrenbergii]|uniref:Uncharacterized protein n=1 Tax=Roseivirga ehrenbergii (strain DSM 102268 / JCM 13514 / KCTC 12282 / NCIMB 14502 / KMM 6017) TaxID=279360 RepID=A0A150XSF3_ROSEK|nr:hypothetical protein MB14_13990 [Roseivirga ehrenbergii]TCL10864.1 hypothetical protein EV198_1896 [Roseivirga ehrenbergii]